MFKQKCIFHPNSDIVKEYYEYLDDVLVYMEETPIEQKFSYGLDIELNEYWFGFLNGIKQRIKKSTGMQGEIVYAPFIPLDDVEFTPRLGISSRYALATVNHNYYGAIQVLGTE